MRHNQEVNDMKKRILAILAALSCLLMCIPVQAADLPQTITVCRYESNGQVIVSEDTLFTIMPDGRVISNNRQELPAPYLYGLYSALVTITKNGSIARGTGALDIKDGDCTFSGKLRMCRSTDKQNWTTKKSKSFTKTGLGVYALELEYAMGNAYYRAELDVNTKNADGITVESITVASGTIEW